MKKILAILTVGAVLFGATSCFATTPTVQTKGNEETSGNADTEKQEETEKPTEKEVEATSALGKRSNPVPLGTAATFPTSYYGEGGEKIEATISVTLSNVVRGDEAYAYLAEANRFNDEAPEGYEWVIFDVELVLDEGSDDEPYNVMGSFTPIASDGSEVEQTGYATFSTGESFGWVEIYKGGKATGKEGKLVPVGDDTLVQFSDWTSKVFFALK